MCFIINIITTTHIKIFTIWSSISWVITSWWSTSGPNWSLEWDTGFWNHTGFLCKFVSMGNSVSITSISLISINGTVNHWNWREFYPLSIVCRGTVSLTHSWGWWISPAWSTRSLVKDSSSTAFISTIPVIRAWDSSI